MAVKQLVDSKVTNQPHISSTDTATPAIRVIIPFKDKTSDNVVEKRLTRSQLGRPHNSARVHQRKTQQRPNIREVKPLLTNNG